MLRIATCECRCGARWRAWAMPYVAPHILCKKRNMIRLAVMPTTNRSPLFRDAHHQPKSELFLSSLHNCREATCCRKSHGQKGGRLLLSKSSKLRNAAGSDVRCVLRAFTVQCSNDSAKRSKRHQLLLHLVPGEAKRLDSI